jgi:hypothetical protein
VTGHGQLRPAFKAAAPRLGLSARLVHAVDWLFRFTQPQDWERGGRPIVWPSAGMQQDGLSLSASRVKAINRQLIEDGLITMRDSPNGKDPDYFRTTPGGYFHGMVAKAKAGELNLDRTLWALRRASEPSQRGKAGRDGAEHRGGPRA